jgi:hypothetical protein
MAVGDVIIGLDGKFYYGTAGSQAGTEAVNIEDVTCNLGSTDVDITRRGSTFESQKPVLLSAEVSGTVQKREGDAFLLALEAAWLAKTPIAIYAKSAAAGKGFDGDVYVKFNDSQPLKDKQSYECTFVPTDEQRNPQFH